MTITASLEYSETLSRALDQVAAALDTPSEVFTDIGELLIEGTKGFFTEGAGPDGTPWIGKSLATVESYRRNEGKGANGPVDMRPLFGPTGRLSSEIHYAADAQGVSWGSSLIYSAVMNFGAAKGAFGTASNGAAIPWGDIPARPFIGLSDQMERDIIDTIEDWLSGAADGN